MLRKEMKELAQRALKGKYGKWSGLTLIGLAPMIFIFLFLTMIVGAVSMYELSSGTFDDYDNSYYEEYDGDDYYDFEETYYTPPYNYGYALGYQTGYLQGWNDYMNDVDYWGTLSTDNSILASIKDRPMDFLASDEFNEGVLDAYNFSYDEAWYDAEVYTDGGNVFGTALLPSENPVRQLNNGFEPYFPESGYTEMPRRTNGFIIFLGNFIMFIVVVGIGLLFGCIYKPWLQWTGIETIDGENFSFSSVFKKIRAQFGTIFFANFKIIVFTYLWSLLFVIPGMVKQMSYSMTNYLLKREPNLDSSRAIRLSEEMMRGYKMEYLIFNLSFFWWYLATAYSLGFAGFYVMPYYYSSEAVFFDQIYYEKRHHSASVADELTGFKKYPTKQAANEMIFTSEAESKESMEASRAAAEIFTAEGNPTEEAESPVTEQTETLQTDESVAPVNTEISAQDSVEQTVNDSESTETIAEMNHDLQNQTDEAEDTETTNDFKE